MVSNTYCVEFLLCFSSFCVTCVASFSRLSIAPSVFSNVYFLVYYKLYYWPWGGPKTSRGKWTLVNRCKGVMLNMTYINAIVKLFSKNYTTRNIAKEI
jgi:hypothetical protein